MSKDSRATGRNSDPEVYIASWDRRGFVKGVAALTTSAALLGYDLRSAAAEPPPETRKIRLINARAACLAPQYLAEDLLRLEGFSQIEYVKYKNETTLNGVVASGLADMTLDTAGTLVPALDSGRTLVVLAGVHGGCWELFANERVRSIRDLKGKSFAVRDFGAPDQVYIASMLAYVGMDPRIDVRWIPTRDWNQSMQLFVEGKADAFLGFPPQPQEVREKKIGHVILNTAQDSPLSEHFCCMVAASREFVGKHPVATKRAVRAILKAADICAREPERAARYMVEQGHEPRYEIALEVVKEVSYTAWRTFDPENTLRFYALRLYEVGMVKSTPQKLIAHGTDWRFLDELRNELKA